MRVRTRHPRLVATACRVYGLMIWLYPARVQACLRPRADPHVSESRRGRAECGGVRDWLAFAAHIAWDTIRTSGTLMATGGPHDSVSLLGLREGDAAHGGLDHATVTVDRHVRGRGTGARVRRLVRLLRHPASVRLVVREQPSPGVYE